MSAPAIAMARCGFLSTRRSAWIMPKYLLGRPIDQVSSWVSRTFKLSTPKTRAVMAWLIRIFSGDQRRFGVPRPDHPMSKEHATLSQDLMPYIGHGYISIKPDVKELRGDRVAFADGSEEVVDSIIHATGYNIRFPFLGSDVFDPDEEAGRLYRRIVSVKHPGLLFAGLVQPVGPTIPLVEVQGRWIAAMLSGKMRVPDNEMQKQEVEAHLTRQKEIYVNSARYVLEVDYRTYKRQMTQDMKSGSAGV